MEDEVLS